MTAPRTISYRTRFGDAWISFADHAIVAMGLPGSSPPHRSSDDAPNAIAELAADLAAYWEGGALPTLPRGMLVSAARTDLDEAIYKRVVAIPAGETMTYAAVAAAVGRPQAARAVGAAMAANRYAPLIPCHRVVGSDGSLRGYAGGIAMKRYLLDLEAAGHG